MKSKNYLKRKKTRHRPKVSRTLVLFAYHLETPLGSRGAAKGQVPSSPPPSPISTEGRGGLLAHRWLSDGEE